MSIMKSEEQNNIFKYLQQLCNFLYLNNSNRYKNINFQYHYKAIPHLSDDETGK